MFLFTEKSAIKLVGYDMSANAAKEAFRQAGITPDQVQVVCVYTLARVIVVSLLKISHSNAHIICICTHYLYLHTLSVSVVRKAGPRAFVPIALRLTSNTPSQKQHPARDICSGGAVPHPHHLMFVHAHIPFFFLCQHSRTQ